MHPFVQKVYTALQSYENREFQHQFSRRDPLLKLAVNLQIAPSAFVEDLVCSVVESCGGTVRKEPNGHNTFPDVEVTAPDGSIHYLEVKSWLSKSRGWSAASLKQFTDAIGESNPKYFHAWYVDFNLSQQELTTTIGKVTFGRVWEFADGNSIGGHTPSIRCNVGTSYSTFFRNAVLKNSTTRRDALALNEAVHSIGTVPLKQVKKAREELKPLALSIADTLIAEGPSRRSAHKRVEDILTAVVEFNRDLRLVKAEDLAGIFSDVARNQGVKADSQPFRVACMAVAHSLDLLTPRYQGASGQSLVSYFLQKLYSPKAPTPPRAASLLESLEDSED